MFEQRRRLVFGFIFVALLSVAGLYLAPRAKVVPESLPQTFSDADFWRLVSEFSEPGGFFRSDNFVSNESTFQYIIPELYRRTKPGGVYLGVGPDQNFTYIAATRPKVAFITDIRRQNMLQHLMYKAVFELSDNRVEFLSKLFSRSLTTPLPDDVAPEKLFSAFTAAESNPDLAKANLSEILEQLRDRHNFGLSPEDVKVIENVYSAFVSAGPEIRYSFPSQYGLRRFPSYSELMLESDGEGENHSYMASDERFRIIKQLETENRIVPIVGDFAGEKALSAIGRYLKEHGATVSVFYTSNVEFYLFQTDDWKKFFNNVSQLPVDANSLLIRAYFNTYGNRFPNQGSQARSVTLLDSMQGMVAAYEADKITSYLDVVKRSTQ